MKKLYFLLYCLLFWGTAAFCQPGQIHLGWNNSDLNGTQKNITITWADSTSKEGFVKYGTDNTLSNTVKIEGKYSATLTTNIFKATLNSLKTHTRYFYKCGSDQSGWSATYSFTTAPDFGSRAKFTVGIWSDTQDNEFNTHFEKSEAIKEQLEKYAVNFTIHTGDIVENGSMPRRWKGYFTMAQSLNATTPFMPVPGNHDVDNKPTDSLFQKPFPVFYDQFNLPGAGIDYSYNYGNTHFVAICSGQPKAVEDAALSNYRFNKDSPERYWLEADLAKARDNKKIKWIVVYMHHPPYAFGVSQVKGWQDQITPILDKYKVDICLAGHRHVYERHTAIYDHNAIPQTDINVYNRPAGTVYITNGTSGGSPQGPGGKDMPTMIYTSAVKMYNYAVMTIADNILSYDVYNEKGEMIDHFKITK
jgi:predicted phosphodiesterase